MGYWNPSGQFGGGSMNPQYGMVEANRSIPRRGQAEGSWQGRGIGAPNSNDTVSMSSQYGPVAGNSSRPKASPGSYWIGTAAPAVPIPYKPQSSPQMTTGQGGNEEGPNWGWFSGAYDDWQNTSAPGGPEHTPYSGTPYQAPGAWQGGGMDAPDSNYDPMRAINASVPWLTEQRDKQWNDAAQRFGQTGFLASTPYMEKLGDVSRKSMNDLDQITQEYLYRDSLARAERDLTAQQGQYDRDLSSWGTQGGWQHQGRMADQDRNFQSWRDMENWAENQSQRDYDWGSSRDLMSGGLLNSLLPEMLRQTGGKGGFGLNFGG